MFVDKTPGRRFGLDEFVGAYAVLQDAIPGTEIGYTTREGIVSCYRPFVEQSAIRIFCSAMCGSVNSWRSAATSASGSS